MYVTKLKPNVLNYDPANSVLHPNYWNKRLLYYRKKFMGSRNLYILDIGGRSRFTDKLQILTTRFIENTIGDIDENFVIPNDHKYSVVIYADIMEHQFNPLHTLLELKRNPATENAIIFISLPDRGKLLWTPHHFHEIDRYRFRLLCERADLAIISIHRQKEWRVWKFYLTGLRPFLRLFFEYSIIYECVFK